MGKFGIGARVRDDDGAAGVIVGKPDKGWREIEYDEGQGLAPGSRCWQPKKRLTLIEPSAEAETVPAQAAEQWVPKGGDRVRYIGDFSPWLAGKSGVVKRIEYVDNVVVDWDDHPQVGGVYPHNLEPLPVADQPAAEVAEPAPFTMEAGKFYRTRDGRKVGPILLYEIGGFFHVKSGTLLGDQLWDGAGVAKASNRNLDIIAEWVDEPAVAVEAVEPAPATITIGAVDIVNSKTSNLRYKIGDKVDLYRDGKPVEFWRDMTITSFDDFFDYRTDRGLPCFDGELELSTPTLTPTPSFIVAKIENGKPRPNTRPVVHASRDAAETEAQRLADKYGDDFAVYERVSVRELDAGPVPGHFQVSLAKDALNNPKALTFAFAWSLTEWGHVFWEAQAKSTLTPLGRAILTKWIAEAEANQAEAAPTTPANDDAPAASVAA